MATVYDICIVGAGMFGSAAARHVTRISPNSKVCVIGPEEPQESSPYNQRTIFGAYYDVGRITRHSNRDIVWSTIDKRCINRYRDLEREAGISFYEDVGCLCVMSKLASREPISVVRDSGLPVSAGKWSVIKSKYNLDYFKFEPDHHTVLEHGFSGYINPRLLVEAQLLLARKRGCDVIRDIVSSVVEISLDGTRIMEVITDSRQKFLSKKVLLSTGAFAAFRSLFPNEIKPNLVLLKQSVVLAEVSEHDRKRFWRMPCLEYDRGQVNGRGYGCYMLPPIQYPDGKYYIKIGHLDQYDFPISTEAEMKEWHCKPSPNYQRDGLVKLLNEILPDFEPVSVTTDTCITTRTPSRRPYIDMVTPRLGVALGGNGCGAKSSDEIGRLAADMMVHGKFLDPELRSEDFKFKAASKL